MIFLVIAAAAIGFLLGGFTGAAIATVVASVFVIWAMH
jgi:hypothetical protein